MSEQETKSRGTAQHAEYFTLYGQR